MATTKEEHLRHTTGVSHMYCPRCHHDNTTTANFCQECCTHGPQYRPGRGRRHWRQLTYGLHCGGRYHESGGAFATAGRAWNHSGEQNHRAAGEKSRLPRNTRNAAREGQSSAGCGLQSHRSSTASLTARNVPGALPQPFRRSAARTDNVGRTAGPG
jgi:hypothetical protein